jgi:hypothetical protein
LQSNGSAELQLGDLGDGTLINDGRTRVIWRRLAQGQIINRHTGSDDGWRKRCARVAAVAAVVVFKN